MLQNEVGIQARWGIPEWDALPYTIIPDEFLKYAVKAGITPQEQLLIIHLVSFHFGQKHSVICPSQSTLAERMGMSRQRVNELIASLKSKGLRVIERVGKTSIYDLTFLSRKIRKLAHPKIATKEKTAVNYVDTCQPQLTPTCQVELTPTCQPQLTRRRENKEDKEYKKRNIAEVVCHVMLKNLGFSDDETKKLMKKHDFNYILFEIDQLRNKISKKSLLERLKFEA